MARRCCLNHLSCLRYQPLIPVLHTSRALVRCRPPGYVPSSNQGLSLDDRDNAKGLSPPGDYQERHREHRQQSSHTIVASLYDRSGWLSPVMGKQTEQLRRAALSNSGS
jgi:hypothetical protein